MPVPGLDPARLDAATPASVDANCDGVLTNQPDLMTDVHNCGACGNDCLVGAVHANWSCTAGACKFQGCQTGYYDNGAARGSGGGRQQVRVPLRLRVGAGGVQRHRRQLQRADRRGRHRSEPRLRSAASAPTPRRRSAPPASPVTCTAGAWKCTFPASVCNPTCATPAIEICDTLDNNCNGHLNENVPTTASPARATTASRRRATARAAPPAPSSAAAPNATTCSAVKDLGKAARRALRRRRQRLRRPRRRAVHGQGLERDVLREARGHPDRGQHLWIYTVRGQPARARPPRRRPRLSATGYPDDARRPAGRHAGQDAGLLGADQDPLVQRHADRGRADVHRACGGHICSVAAEWQTACKENPPGATTCTLGYAPYGAACTTALGPPYAFPFVGGTFCNLGPTYDFDAVAGGDQDGLLATGSASAQELLLRLDRTPGERRGRWQDLRRDGQPSRDHQVLGGRRRVHRRGGLLLGPLRERHLRLQGRGRGLRRSRRLLLGHLHGSEVRGRRGWSRRCGLSAHGRRVQHAGRERRVLQLQVLHRRSELPAVRRRLPLLLQLGPDAVASPDPTPPSESRRGERRSRSGRSLAHDRSGIRDWPPRAFRW